MYSILRLLVGQRLNMLVNINIAKDFFLRNHLSINFELCGMVLHHHDNVFADNLGFLESKTFFS